MYIVALYYLAARHFYCLLAGQFNGTPVEISVLTLLHYPSKMNAEWCFNLSNTFHSSILHHRVLVVLCSMSLFIKKKTKLSPQLSRDDGHFLLFC